MLMPANRQDLLNEFEAAARTVASANELMVNMSERLHHELARYNWVGFYLPAPDEPETLVLGPFSGSFTPHDRIPYTQGLCGAVARSHQTVVVNDVAADPRYLQGSSTTKSEAVVPVLARQKFVAELDINSYFANTFSPEDVRFLESCSAIVGHYFEQH
jgi:GAF domain-containing protein